MKTTHLGRSSCLDMHFNPMEWCRPNPIVTYSSIWYQGRKYFPNPGDRHTLILLKRQTPKKVSFSRAYSGWRASGAKEELELGEGRSFLRWLTKHSLSIEWKENDFTPHPYFLGRDSPKHDKNDDMAQGLSFAIRPVRVIGRNIKLYVQDKDIVALLALPYGNDEDFLELVMQYIAQRFEWATWRAPAPHFLNWVINQGKRPVFNQGQLGFNPL